jgi:hypothetical protein
VGRWMAAGSCGAIQDANKATITKATTNTTPAAASGLWRAFCVAQPATRRRNEMALVNMALVNMALVNMEKILNRPGLEIARKLCFHKRNAATVSPVRTRAINLHL